MTSFFLLVVDNEVLDLLLGRGLPLRLEALEEVLDGLVALGLGQVGDGAGGALAETVPGKGQRSDLLSFL